MTNNQRRVAETQDECDSPALKGLLTAYVVELIDDSAAAEVGEHLLYCLHCRETYLKFHYVLGGLSDASFIARQGVLMMNASKVVNIADFRRYRR